MIPSGKRYKVFLMDRIASPATFVSSAGTVYFGLTLNDIGVAVGIISTLAALVMNWYFKRQHLKLAEGLAARGIAPDVPKD